MPNTQKAMEPTVPDVIYLQWYDEDGEYAENVTWCVDHINGTDIPYVRDIRDVCSICPGHKGTMSGTQGHYVRDTTYKDS